MCMLCPRPTATAPRCDARVSVGEARVMRLDVAMASEARRQTKMAARNFMVIISGRYAPGVGAAMDGIQAGATSPEQVCAFYRESGYDFLALTDHFLERYGYPITDTLPYRTTGFTTLLGAELHTGQTELGNLWHILSVGLPADFAPNLPGETGPQIARRALT